MTPVTARRRGQADGPALLQPCGTYSLLAVISLPPHLGRWNPGSLLAPIPRQASTPQLIIVFLLYHIALFFKRVIFHYHICYIYGDAGGVILYKNHTFPF